MTMTVQVQKIHCNLCNMFFLSNDELLQLRLKKHEEWHKECTYFGSSNVRMIREVVWRYEN